MRYVKSIVFVIVAFSLLSQLALAGRYYDPEIGRFTTPDPALEEHSAQELTEIGLGQLLHTSPYAYANNNPLLYIDPTGKYVIKASSVSEYGPYLMSATLETEKFASSSAQVRNIFSDKIGTPVDAFVGFGLKRNDGTIKGIGNGPEIVVRNLDEWSGGSTPPFLPGKNDPRENQIYVAKWLVQKLDSSTPKVREMALELFKRTVLHETAHRLNQTGYDVHGNTLNKFDQEAFGENPRTGTYDSMWEWWKEEWDREHSSGDK